MARFRYQDVQQARGVGRTFAVSLNDLYPETDEDDDRSPLPTPIPRPRLGLREKFRLLEPFVSARLKDQLSAVIPLAGYLALFSDPGAPATR